MQITLPFELLLLEISKIEMPNEDKEFIKSMLKDRDKYLEEMSKMLNNDAKFEMLRFDHDKKMNVLNLRKKISMFWKI